MEELLAEQYNLSESIKDLYLKFQNKPDPLKSVGAANIQLRRLETYYEKFVANSKKIKKTLDPTNPYITQNEDSRCIDNYYDVKGLFTEYIRIAEASEESLRESQRVPTPQAAPTASASYRHLPKIEIPTFSGKYNEWENFRDLFRSIVHSNESIPTVDKFHYLRTYVTGKALTIVKPFSITALNYAAAWDALKAYYENKRRIVHAHLTDLFAVKPMKSESAEAITTLMSGIFTPLEALKDLQRPTEHWDDPIVFFTVSRFDENTLKEWHKVLGDSPDYPTLAKVKKFLEGQLMIFESIESKTKTNMQSHSQASRKISSNSSHLGASSHQTLENKDDNKTRQCVLCNEDHSLMKCNLFKSKNEHDRYEIVKNNRLCTNCFGPHATKQCKSNFTCAQCKKKHHSMLHFKDGKNSHSTACPHDSENQEKFVPDHKLLVDHDKGQSSHHTHPYDVKSSGGVILATALVKVIGANGIELNARALIDPCSQSSIISGLLCQRLKLTTRKVFIPINGTGGNLVSTARKAATLTIKSRTTRDFSHTLEALVLPNVSNYKPPPILSALQLSHLEGLVLADPQHMNVDTIDLLLGAPVWSHIVEGTVIKGAPNEPIATRTALGWVISGDVPGVALSSSITSLHMASDQCLDSLLQQFWTQEEVPKCSPYTADEQVCEQHYASTHSRDSAGRYVVRLPFRGGGPLPRLSDSYFRARSMLLKMEARFEKDPQLKIAYLKSMDDFENHNHMVIQDPLLLDHSEKAECFYLPHHGVLKESSSTTKLRTVFNGSAKMKSGVSLNDLLHAGPNLLPHLPDLICAWRMYKYVFSADVEKMFRQIRVHPADVKYQSLLWRDDSSQPIQAFCLTSVSFGLVCSPYLANRTIKQLALDERDKHALGATVAESEIYMDDVVSGEHDLQIAASKARDTYEIFASAGLPLRKWVTNHEAVLADLPESILAVEPFALRSAVSDTSILGLYWNPIDDTFSFKVSPLEPLAEATKRAILSRIARLFDPMGWLAPIVVLAKGIMRDLWLAKTGWDQPTSEECQRLWRNWYEKLEFIEQIKIPRWNQLTPQAVFVEVHGFSDASESAYGAAIYLRVGLTDRVVVNLQTSKSRSAPLKKLSIPKLELSAAYLLSKLTQRYLDKSSNIPTSVHLWTDAKIVLCWLSKAPSTWETYIANRCSIMLDLVPNGQWHHVRSKQNPADIVSRGCSADELKDNSLWWNGPSYLTDNLTEWPISVDYTITQEELLKASNVSASFSTTTKYVLRDSQTPYTWEPIDRFSKWSKVLRVTSYCLRFILALLKTRETSRLLSLGFLTTPIDSPYEGEITVLELNRSRLFLIHLHQVKIFSSVIKRLQKKKTLDNRDPLLGLNLGLYEGLIRVGGRLGNSFLPFENQHPLLLHNEDKITRWLIKEAHMATEHGGPLITLATLRLRYWVLKGRYAVKAHISKCIPCCRWSKRNRTQLMGNLPLDRTSPTPAFLKAGVDYAGPIKIRLSKCRGNVTTKGYIVVFVCFSTHAVHLEPVEDYSSQAFLSAFDRFRDRRGKCSDLYSDRGTTFVGADKELKKLFDIFKDTKSPFVRDLTEFGTRWHFNPPGAPHFGGLWESAVKSVKHHLVRVIGQSILTFVEMTTLLCRIEAVLNSRPLVALTDDVNDLETLTPAQLLTGRPSFIVPGPDRTDEKIPLSRRYDLRCQMAQHYWNRWSRDYLTTLHKRNKWRQPQPSFKAGDLVLIKDEVTPPGQWPLARITAVHPGNDNLVRAVTVKTATQTFKRPTVKLISLPVLD